MKFDKDYYENYAKLTLCRIVDESFQKLKKSECPDWIMDDNSLGIEVTRAVPQNWAQTDNIVNKYFGKGLNGEFIKHNIEKSCKRGFNGSINVIDGHAIYSPTKDVLYDFSIYLDEIINCINNKEGKLKDYQPCAKMGLYIFAGTSMMNKGDIEKIISNVDYSFDKIYINDSDKLFIVDNIKSISEIEITNEELKYIKIQSQIKI